MSELFGAGPLRRLQKWWTVLPGLAGVLNSPARIGIAGRLSVAFAGVAVLAVAANLFAEHGLAIVALTSGTDSLQAPGHAPWLRHSVERASASVFESIDRFDAAAAALARSNSPRTNAAFAKATANLDRETSAYLAAARAFADPARLAALAAQVQEHRKAGTALVRDADHRRALAMQYSAVLQSLSARVQASVDHTWKFLGRLIGRKSLVDLNQTLETIRLQSVPLVAGESYDTTTLEALGASEARLVSLLEADARGLTRAEGKEWIDQSRADIGQLGSLRGELSTLDRQRPAVSSAFRTAGRSLARAITVLDAEPVREETSAAEVSASDTPQLNPGSPRDGSTLATRLSDEGRVLLWTSAIVLTLILLLSIATTLSIVRPVGRFVSAMRRLALGDSSARMSRGGLKELDTLAVAFNHMAEQICAYQGQLESKVTERTLQFQHLAEHDPLTQLPNRRQLLSYLKHAIERARRTHERVAVLFIDLDNFKTINDSMGHAFGDRVLVSIAQRVSEVVGPSAFIARLGGDEFTVVYDTAQSENELSESGRRLVQTFAAPLRVDGRELSISISVGASVFPDHAQSAEALLSAADVALFHAKASGRSKLGLFSPALLEAASERFRIEQGLRQAIDREEFELHFQPEIALATFSTSVLEALLRWRTADGTYIAPGQFLAVAEQSGLILEIGDWVLRRAIQTTARWYYSGATQVRVAINVSARQLMEPGFVNRVTSLLEGERLPAACIELELTENVLQTDPATIDVLRALRAESIAVALDDFGTGYSSLASLERLPLTRVKLDRSLISAIHTSPRSLAIAQSIIGLCRGLGLEVTAEGIEEPEQLALLLAEKNVHAQGFLIARPARESDVPSVLQRLPAHMQSLLKEVPVRTAPSLEVARWNSLPDSGALKQSGESTPRQHVARHRLK